ncbi:pyrokinin-1 receptor-like [Mytilus galloprovincialis]|uniref:Neuromedin U receptor 1 n=1 Tax=Mytilus galloprovincialis TaxID=29158 RepID=A0A8B6EZM9_MYTGA|nr:neuromedin U receptor 1 [Mytilus galloprovincialis]
MAHPDLLSCINLFKNGSISSGSLNCSHYRHNGFKDILKFLLKNTSVTRKPKDEDVWQYLEDKMFPSRDDLSIVIPITIIYTIIFLTGLLGNVFTCIVIARNKFMHTATNYYLFNLAVADLLLLCAGLPSELYTIWNLYPWVFGETVCILRALFGELSTYTSILTISAFTVERYVAICHPMKAQKMSSLHRAVRVIFSTWIIASVLSIPQTIQYGVVYIQDENNRTIKESAMCTNKKTIKETFLVSSLIFFLFPMTFISILYTLIALAIRRSSMRRSSADSSTREHVRGIDLHVKQQSRARKSVIKMLVAVVVGFFVCWAPFHVERLVTSNIESWSPFLLRVYRILFYSSGVCYFCSCTINPILYSIMSLKFRQALKQTFAKSCCQKIPRQNRKTRRFSYKFVHKNGQTETSYTTVGPLGIIGSCKKKSMQKIVKDKVVEERKLQRTKKASPSPSISGSSLKSTDEMCQEEEIDKVLFQIKCYDSNRNTSQLVVGVC